MLNYGSVGFAVPPPASSELYSQAETEGQVTLRASVSCHCKPERVGNLLKAPVEIGLLRGRCDMSNLQVLENYMNKMKTCFVHITKL